MAQAKAAFPLKRATVASTGDEGARTEAGTALAEAPAARARAHLASVRARVSPVRAVVAQMRARASLARAKAASAEAIDARVGATAARAARFVYGAGSVAPVPPPLPPQVGRDLADEVHGEALLLAGALEHQQGDDGLAVDVPRLEDRHQLGGEPLEILGAPFLGEEAGEVEGDQRRVEAHLALQELPLDLPEGGLGGTETAQAEVDVPLDPAQADEVERLGGLSKKRCKLRQKLLRLAEEPRDHQAAQQVVPCKEDEARVPVRVDLVDGSLQAARSPLTGRPSPRESSPAATAPSPCRGDLRSPDRPGAPRRPGTGPRRAAAAPGAATISSPSLPPRPRRCQ